MKRAASSTALFLAFGLTSCSSSPVSSSAPDASKDVARDVVSEAQACGGSNEPCCAHDACASGLSCQLGTCLPPADAGVQCSSDMDCVADGGADPDASDGEAPPGVFSCKGGQCVCEASCGGLCVNEQLDPNHCGSCDTVCAENETCQTGKCACKGTTCPSASGGAPACVDTMTDNSNCGGCGKTCDYTCAGGVCGPSVLAARQYGPLALDTSAQKLILRVGLPTDGFYSCSTSGCGGAPSLIVADDDTIEVLAASDGNVFYVPASDSYPELMTCSESGCSSAATIGQTSSSGITIAGSTLYWTDYDNHILSCPASGTCTPTTVATITGVNGVVVDGSDLYYNVSTGCGDCGTLVGSIYVADVNAQNPTLIASDTSGQSASLLFASGGQVFWAGVGGLKTASRTIPETIYLPLGPGEFFELAWDGTSIYILDYAGADVAKCAIGATCTTPVTVVPSSGLPLGPNIAVDDTNVYWIGNENLYKFHK